MANAPAVPPLARAPRARMHAVLVAFTLLIALAWRLIGLTATDVWADEAMTLMIVRASWWDLLVHLPFAMDHPPLAFLPFKAWSLVSTSETWMRLLPVLQGVAAVAVLMLVAWRIDPRAALPTGLLAAVSPVPVHYSQELRAYSQLFLLSGLALWGAQEALRCPKSRWRAAAPALAGALSAHSHAVGMFVYPMSVVFMLVLGGPRGWQAVIRPAGAWLWLLLVAPMVWFNLHWSGRHLDDWWVLPPSLYHFRKHAEAFFGLSIVETWEFNQTSRPIWISYALQRALIIIPAAWIIMGLLNRRLRGVLVALAAAASLYVGSLLLVGALSVPNIVIRTLLPAWAPVLVLLGTAVAAAIERVGRVTAAVSLGVTLLILGAGWIWSVAEGPPQRMPTRDAYAWIRARLGPNDLVVVTPPWLTDLTGYYLADAISGEQLLGDGVPLYEGDPPVRQMAWATVDPRWRERLSAALARLEASAGDYSIWYLQFGGTDGPRPGNIPELLTERHRPAEAFFREDAKTVAVMRYVPLTATRPAR